MWFILFVFDFFLKNDLFRIRKSNFEKTCLISKKKITLVANFWCNSWCNYCLWNSIFFYLRMLNYLRWRFLSLYRITHFSAVDIYIYTGWGIDGSTWGLPRFNLGLGDTMTWAWVILWPLILWPLGVGGCRHERGAEVVSYLPLSNSTTRITRRRSFP